MAPARPLKRQKTNEGEQAQPPPIPSPEREPSDSAEHQQVPAQSTTLPEDSSNSPWYRTWPRKAASITQVTRENIATNDSASEISHVQPGKRADRRSSARSPSLAMTLGKVTTSNRSLPIDATTSKIHAVPQPSNAKAKQSPPSDNSPTKNADPVVSSESRDAIGQRDEQKTSTASDDKQADEQTPKPTSAATKSIRGSGWFGWSTKQEDAGSVGGTVNESNTPTSEVHESANSPSKPETSLQSGSVALPKDETTAKAPNNKRTWLQMWGDSSGPNTPKLETEDKIPNVSDKTKSLNIPKTPKTNTPSQASSLETSPPPPLSGDGNKSSGWVFWSRDRQKNLSKSSIENQPHIGEIAISDDPSQARPKRASISLKKDEPRPEVKAQPSEPESTPKTEISKDQDGPTTPKPGKKGKAGKIESAHAAAMITQTPTDSDSTRTASPEPSLRRTQNLLLPQLHETLHISESPSMLQQLSRLLYYTKEPELKHLSLVRDPPRIQNALAIGVHGYFPGPMVRTLIGQPTGTSIKFAELAAKSIRKWTNNRGYDCQVKTAALEGEGKIAERVELLWKLLLNWIDEIRKTDFVMVACHSQGVPVAIMLVAKLIQFGCVNAARVGICAMAGVNTGPFLEFRSRWISGSAGELFDFSDPSSKVSQDYQNALEMVLKAGVRLSLIGSIDDQLVSLDSSIFAPISHPHIYRAVLVDSRLHAPNFLSHLVGFVLKLRNLGVQDHGLIRELSSPLAGSLYTGEGHSRIYDDDAVYDLAVAFALETNGSLSVPLHRHQSPPSAANPYILPFAMRGILEEEFVKTQLQEEAQQLLKQFDDWRPTTKALKDVKFRLEGVRSKL